MPRPSEDLPPPGEATRSASERLLGEVISGRYRVTKLLATGGVSSVYLGQHIHMRKHVAIKVLDANAEKLPEFVTRFQREAVAGAHVQHPNIASATDFGQLDDGSYFLVQEYVPGQTLNRVIAAGRLDPARAVTITRRLASGLGAAHDVGIIHRDVKPSNVILVEGTEDVVKLIDFGFAKLRFSDVPTLAPPPDESAASEKLLTAAGVVLGTVAYMAPEAARGMSAVDQRSDLYALGLIFYELLSGQHPFDATEPVRLFLQQRTETPPPLATRVPGLVVPPEIERVVMRLLEKDPQDRYPSGAEVVAALDAAAVAAGFEIITDIVAASRVSRTSIAPEGEVARAERTSIAPEDDGARTSTASMAPPEGSVVAAPQAAGIAGPAFAALPAFAERIARVPAVAALLAKLPVNGRFPRWAYVAFPAIVVLFVVTIALLRARPAVIEEHMVPAVSDGIAAPTTAQAAAQPIAPATPTAAREVAMEVAGLDASGWRMNLRNAARKKDWVAASEAVLTLFRLDPSAFRDHDVQAALRNTAVGLEDAGGEASDKFFDALSQGGSEGLDLVYDVARYRTGTKAGKRATEILRKPETMMAASPALKVLFDFRETSCPGRRDLFGRMAEQGDERALAELVGQREADCGRRDPCCYKESRALAASIRSLRSRLSAPPPVQAPPAP